jgi:hypothetical protein
MTTSVPSTYAKFIKDEDCITELDLIFKFVSAFDDFKLSDFSKPYLLGARKY